MLDFTAAVGIFTWVYSFSSESVCVFKVRCVSVLLRLSFVQLELKYFHVAQADQSAKKRIQNP